MGLSYVAPSYPLHNRGICVGDSHTFNITTGLALTDFYPAKVEAALRLNRGQVQFSNQGASGDTTAQMLARISALSEPPYPKIGIIYGGTNDGSGGSASTTSNLIAIGEALQGLGFTRLIVGLQHYLNFDTAGDTLETPLTANVTLRQRQQAAADALGAVVANFYEFDRARIVAGQDVQGSASWHVGPGDTHRNAYGQTIFAECVMSVITDEWRGALA